MPHFFQKNIHYYLILPVSAFLAPQIVEDPKNQTVDAGFNITFNCTAKGHPMPSIKWIKNDNSLAIRSNPRINVSQTDLDDVQIHSQLIIKDVKREDNGKYHCLANNSEGEKASNPAFLSTKDLAFFAPQIVEDPKNQTADAGFNITFNCTAKGHPMPSIKWIKNDNSLAVRSNPRINVSQTDLDDVKIHSQLIIEDVKREDDGKYHCLANNSEGEKASNPAFLSTKDLDGRARIIEDPVNQTAFVGFNVTFNCSASGLLKRNITWVKNNNSHAVNSNPRVKVIRIPLDGEGILQSQLSIKEVKEEDKGKYYCVAKSSAGEIESKSAFLFIKHLASPRKERQHSVPLIIVLSVFGGTIITFMCGCTMAFFYRRARTNEEQRNIDKEEIYVACISNKDLAEGMPKDTNADTKGRVLSEANAMPPLVDAEKKNTDALNKKKHKQDDGNVASIPRVSSKGRKTLTPSDVGDKHFRNPIFDKKGHAEEFLISRNSHLDVEDGCSHCDINKILYPDNRMDEDDGDSDEMQKSVFVKLEESEKDRGNLEVLDEVLGRGEYGIVYKGRYGGRNGSITDVAVKKLKGNANTLAKAALLNEIKTLKQAGRHPNIVNLVGTWRQGETIFVVTELVHGGSLESLLKCKEDESNEYANVVCELNDRQLLRIALQVALGMQHLEEKKCIHRDLAARNVFIDSNMVAKVGDFGLAREILEDGLYVKTSCGKIPWRWSSLESLRDRVYTSKSDVWSFGILLWEIATYGDSPYPDIATPLALVSRLSTGYRMPRPDQCSEELYTLMGSCWNENPLMRPSFADIVDRLEYFLREVKRTYINITEDEISGRFEVK
ncbi:Fibroblast growth factor receptor 4 [Stylophora pistillata]|uniref:receptor protein-tyrosine kinase n=1 Tax=Stylophora pistillata TaxID=50429 RepID=A0A2B4RD91_STYPI|nr:Fibroblast growth factor receptor 4 [Stylophora pistillata]